MTLPIFYDYLQYFSGGGAFWHTNYIDSRLHDFRDLRESNGERERGREIGNESERVRRRDMKRCREG